jgi:hypothetical protein
MLRCTSAFLRAREYDGPTKGEVMSLNHLKAKIKSLWAWYVWAATAPLTDEERQYLNTW